MWSGRRDSNPRQPAWKAGTLATELRPHLTNNCCGTAGRKLHYIIDNQSKLYTNNDILGLK